MRTTSRTTNRRHLLHDIYPSNINTITNSHPIPKQLIQYPHPILHNNQHNRPMNRPIIMTRLLSCIYSKNTTIWPSPMTTKSPCRSPNRRLHSTSSNSPKTRRLRHYPNNASHTNNKNRYIYTIPNYLPLRSNPSQPNMPPTDRFKITNRILINQPHRLSNRSNHNSNPVKPSRGHSPNNCPWIHLIYTILPR